MTKKLNRRSQLITAGVARSPNRAMLRAVGFKDGTSTSRLSAWRTAIPP